MTTKTRAELVAAVAVAVALAASFASGARAGPTCRTDGRYAMGTVLEIQLCGEAPPAAFEQSFATAAALDAILTTWADDSALLRLNRTGEAIGADVPEALRAILVAAIGYRRVTQGAFDVSVGPLIELWREAGRRQVLPSPQQLATTRARVGSGRIEMRADGSVRLPSGMSLSFGGLAKGFALDRIAHDLRRDHVGSALLDFGQSSLVALGAPPDASGWNLWVRRPDGPVVGTVSLRDLAASVSATYGQSLRIGAKRYSHVIDPRTGRPVDEDRLAFVVAGDASLAEAWSTALVVLGDPGLDLVESMDGVEALLVAGASGRLVRTSGFDRTTRFTPAARRTRPPGELPHEPSAADAPRKTPVW